MLRKFRTGEGERARKKEKRRKMKLLKNSPGHSGSPPQPAYPRLE